MASAKKRQEERTDLDWTEEDTSSRERLPPNEDDDDDYDVIYDDEDDVRQVSMMRRGDTVSVVYDAPPTSGQMLRGHVADVYGPMTIVQ